MGKLSGIDYDLVEERAKNILKSKSKDIRAMAFLSFVLLKADKWEEFADLFEGLAALAETSFEGLHPERAVAKTNSFKWLSEDRYIDFVSQKKSDPTCFEHYSRLYDALTKIKGILEKNYPEGSPFPTHIYKCAQQFRDQTKPKPQPVAPPVAPVSPEGSGSGVSAAPSASSASPQASASSGVTDVIDSPKSAQASIRAAARFLIEKEDVKPMGYRILRAVRWDLLEKAPPAEGGKTQLTGPNPQQRTYFANLSSQTEFKTLLIKSEEAFVGGANHLWLDLQRYSAFACKSLGDGFKSVHAAILIETAMLIKRIPELTGLSYSDGGSFCDPATRDWIEGEVNGALGSGDGAVASAKSVGSSAFDAENKEINALVAANKLDAAIEYLGCAIRSSAIAEDNFKRTILMGDLLLKAKQPDIASAVLESLDEKITQYHLDSWNPDLAAEALVKLGQSYKASRINKQPPLLGIINEKYTQVVRKLSQINPKKAWELNV